MIAFVLSGGGCRGAVQAGALLALLERNIRPDLVVGTSVGALNGVALATNPTLDGAQWIAESWRRVRRHDIFPGNPFTVGWRLLCGGGSLHPQDSFQRFVSSMMMGHVERFGELRVPCKVTATVLSTGQLHIFGNDPQESVVDAIMASTAIPPFFPPYCYKDELLVDGAVVANLPLQEAVNCGALTIYALKIVERASSPNGSLAETLSYALNAMLSRQDEQEHCLVGMLRRRGVTIHNIQLEVGRPRSYSDFDHSKELIDVGYSTTMSYLKAHLTPETTPVDRWRSMIRDLPQIPSFSLLARQPERLAQFLKIRKA